MVEVPRIHDMGFLLFFRMIQMMLLVWYPAYKGFQTRIEEISYTCCKATDDLLGMVGALQRTMRYQRCQYSELYHTLGWRFVVTEVGIPLGVFFDLLPPA